ncbi:response regulator [Fibrobacterota bacterium]
MRNKSLEILLIEDNPGDVRLTQEALSDSQITCHLNVVCDGVEAMNYLRKKGRYLSSARPDIILLDLNLPKKDGREVLHEIKTDTDLKRIPVIILTTSANEQDVSQAYELCANCYILKPVDIDGCLKIFRSVKNFWCNQVTLPPG